jgi:hypothetical protein
MRAMRWLALASVMGVSSCPPPTLTWSGLKDWTPPPDTPHKGGRASDLDPLGQGATASSEHPLTGALRRTCHA